MASQINGASIVCSIVVQAQPKEIIKTLRHWPLCEEVTGELPAQRPVTRKMFPFDDVIMILSFKYDRNYPNE